MSSGFGPEEVTSEGEESTLRPRSHDVLSGRGNYVNYHPGNEHFRNLVKKYKKVYVTCPKAQKGKYSRLIVDQIFAMDPPGRFLKKDSETKQWGDIGEKKALDKTRQALREGAPELVKELGTVASSDEEPDPAKPIKQKNDHTCPHSNETITRTRLSNEREYITRTRLSLEREYHSHNTPNTATPDHTESAFVSGLDTNSVKVSYRAQQFEPTPIDQMVQHNSTAQSSAQYGQNQLITVSMPLPGKAEEDKDAADQNKEDMRETGSTSTASLKVSDLEYRNPKHEDSSGNMSFSITDLEKGNLSSMFTDSLIITTSDDDDESSFSGRISSEKNSGSTTLSEEKESPSIVRRPSYLKKVPCNQSSTISGMSFGVTGGMSGSTDLLDSVQHMSFTNFDDSLRTDNKRTD
eukprot:scaffold36555_cov51-Attheya_sp.AAC.6